MKIIFRTDASTDIGSGHVMRCLTLADRLRKSGVEISFICRDHRNNLSEFIMDSGYEVFLLPLKKDKKIFAVQRPEIENMYEKWLGESWEIDANQTNELVKLIQPDWLIIDHYGIDESWELRLKSSCKRIMVIDDILNRHHSCDLLLDQTFDRMSDDYSTLTPEHCIKLTGSEYALLRPEFAELRDSSIRSRENYVLKHILIFMGGVDKYNVTDKTLEILKLCSLPEDCRITVVMGTQSPWINQVKLNSLTMPWKTEVRTNVSEMARLMAESDLAIGAAGSASWERCCLGLPTLMVVVADNQREAAVLLKEHLAVILLELNNNFAKQLSTHLSQFIENPNILRRLSKKTATIVDGKGCERVAHKLINFL
jgi:UDP-2,4-diacetamido-2,4,6-trideoxy-beta-L-altropyranose hydrolase